MLDQFVMGNVCNVWISYVPRVEIRIAKKVDSPFSRLLQNIKKYISQSKAGTFP
jgi:hypothetical protein